VKLTDEGRGYASRVAERLDALERDTLELMAGAGGLPLIELAVVPTFGTRWLLPRLSQFMHGAVQINLHTRTRPFLFDDTPFDAAIYAGDLSAHRTLRQREFFGCAGEAFVACRGIEGDEGVGAGDAAFHGVRLMKGRVQYSRLNVTGCPSRICTHRTWRP
jgi:DNA-binding transcriptional LysR family regulator